MHTLPRGARPPRLRVTVLRPGRREALPTGATAFLEIQQANHQSRKNGGHKRGQHIPEKVLHGVNLLCGGRPRRQTMLFHYPFQGAAGVVRFVFSIHQATTERLFLDQSPH